MALTYKEYNIVKYLVSVFVIWDLFPKFASSICNTDELCFTDRGKPSQNGT